jgi:hypothetical protein
MWSQTALAAEAALDNFLAAIIAAPLLATVVIKSPCNHLSSPTAPLTVEVSPLEGKLLILANEISGYYVTLWFPHMIKLFTSETGHPTLSDI